MVQRDPSGLVVTVPAWESNDPERRPRPFGPDAGGAGADPVRQRKERIVSRLLHNMSAPPSTEVRAEMRRVADRIVIFSLVHALIARGVLEAPEEPEKLPKRRKPCFS